MRAARSHKKGFIHRLVTKRLRGFSLIELLVVIGILSILIAVVLTSLNVQRNYQKARDSVRESDVNQIHKALTQYYIDHHCLPLQSLWDNLNCNSEVPDELKPYFSKIPCDPETHEKYYVEFQDKNCKRCNEGCGVCIGLRVLTSLHLPKGRGGGVAAGCDEDRGCGIFRPNGDPYNYGIGSNNYCVVPTPTLIPPSGNSPTPTNTLAPMPTNTSAPTPTATPALTPTPTPRQPELWIGAYRTTERFRLDGTRIATVSGSLGHMDSSPFVIQVGSEVWAPKFLSGSGAPVIRRYTKDGDSAGSDLTNAEMVSANSLLKVGSQIWMGSSSNPYYGNKGTITRMNLDGSIAASTLIVNPNGGTDLLMVGQEVWFIDKMKAAIWRFNQDGTQIGSTIYYNDPPNNQNTTKPQYLRSGAVVGDKVWVPMMINSVSKIMRLNLDGTIYGSYITGFNGSTYTADDVVVVGAEVWVLLRANHDVIARYDVNGNLLGTIPVDIEYAEFMYLVQ